MKRIWVTVTNVFIMVAMITFVVVYAGIENRDATEMQIEHFENTTITMEHVTENYLEGEQRICDVWAHYINSEAMTMEDAVSFIRLSHVLSSTSAHIVYVDTLTGQSSKPRPHSGSERVNSPSIRSSRSTDRSSSPTGKQTEIQYTTGYRLI